MPLEFSDLAENLRLIQLDGRLDIPGTDAIATKLAALCASDARRVIVDLSAVTFLSSIGIRALVSNAKAQQQRGGKLVLLVPLGSPVEETLTTTGIDALIPMCDTAEAAKLAVMA